MRTTVIAAALTVWAGVATAQRAPIASNPQVDLEGVVQHVQMTFGQGMPYVTVDTIAGSVRVYLGPLRYLVEQNFNPKTGDKVKVHGYQFSKDVMAATVTNETTGQSLQFRDENGWPLWRPGMRRQPRTP